jgi:hypothetical protein
MLNSTRHAIHETSSIQYPKWDRRDRDRLVVGSITICAISAYHH